jgi:hypothetical protein
MLVSSIKGACGVAAGWTGAMVIAGRPMDYHDLPPWPLLLTEAGGRVSDLHGNDVRNGDGSLPTPSSTPRLWCSDAEGCADVDRRGDASPVGSRGATPKGDCYVTDGQGHTG